MIKLDPDVIFIYVQLKVFEHNLSFYCLFMCFHQKCEDGDSDVVKTENEKRRFAMKVQAFCEEKGLRSFLGVFGYAESKNQCWQAEKWLLHHLICIFPRWPPKLRKTSIAAN